MNSVHKYYRINPRENFFIKFILEAYDGIALMETIDPKQGLIKLYIPQSCEKDVDCLMEALSKDIPIKSIDITQENVGAPT